MKERLGRYRWLEWTNVFLWGVLGGYGTIYIPRLEPVFASFGSELPASTRLFLRLRPLFMVVFIAALAGAVVLILRPGSAQRWRPALWAGAAAAVLAGCGVLSALFAPMFLLG